MYVLADQFAIQSGFSPAQLNIQADQTIALSGPGYNGNETAAFIRKANFVFVVIGVAPDGSPDPTVQDVEESAVLAVGS